MHVFSTLDRSGLSTTPMRRDTPRAAAPSLPWPFAAALIVGASGGLWLLVFRVARALLG